MQTQHTIRSIIVRGAGLALIASMLLAASAYPGSAALADGGAWIGVVPSELQVPVDGVGTTDIKVDNISNLYGAEFHLSFNPACVQVKGDADPSTPGIQIPVGPLFTGGNAFVGKNDADNAAGKVDFVATLKHPAMPVTGNGVVASINWTVKCASALTFTSTKLGDVNGIPIVHTVGNGDRKSVV